MGTITGLQDVNLREHATRVTVLRERATEARVALGDALYERIGQLPKSSERYTLLRIRRRVHQGKDPSPAELRRLDQHEGLQQLWQVVATQTRVAIDAQIEFDRFYEECWVSAEAEVATAWTDLGLLKAIAMASPDLFDALGRGASRDKGFDSDGTFTSAARYLYRAHMKVSPFSGFTVVSDAEIARVPHIQFHHYASRAEVRRISMSGFLLDLLWEAALSVPPILSGLLCRVNSTADQSPDRVGWYFNVGNREALREMSLPTWMVAFLGALLMRREASVAETSAMLRDLSGLDMGRAEATVTMLLRAGLLTIQAPTSTAEPEWPSRMERWFRDPRRAGPDASEFARLLAELRRHTLELPGAAPAKRVQALASAMACVESLLTRYPARSFFDRPPPLSGRAPPAGQTTPIGPKLSKKSLFYEDVRGTLGALIPEGEAATLCAQLDWLADRAVLLNPNSLRRRAFGAFLENRFGADCTVSLLRAFGEIQRFRRTRIEADDCGHWLHFAEADAIESEQAQRVTEWCGAIAEAVASRIEGKPSEVTVRMEDILAGNPHIEGWIRPPEPTSRSATLQLGQIADGTSVWVMHHPVIGGGFGRAFSRFLPLFHSRFTDDLRRWNHSQASGARLVENRDGSRFTGNAHPWLVPEAIEMPGGDNRRTDIVPLPVSQLSVEVRAGRASLVGPDGRDRIICDLGFQTQGRSSLFEVLNVFADDGLIQLNALLSAITSQWFALSGAQPCTAPRIVFGSGVVLQRRLWQLSEDLLQAAQTVNRGEWYRLVGSWWDDAGLPDACFFKARGGGRRARKPQYVHLNDLISCELLRSAAQRGGPVELEEMYPGPDLLPQTPLGRHPIEVSLTWYAR